jgi:hypothetical protein
MRKSLMTRSKSCCPIRCPDTCRVALHRVLLVALHRAIACCVAPVNRSTLSACCSMRGSPPLPPHLPRAPAAVAPPSCSARSTDARRRAVRTRHGGDTGASWRHGGMAAWRGYRVDDEQDALPPRARQHRLCDAVHPIGAAAGRLVILEFEFVLLMFAGAVRPKGYGRGCEAVEGYLLFLAIEFDTNDVP